MKLLKLLECNDKKDKDGSAEFTTGLIRQHEALTVRRVELLKVQKQSQKILNSNLGLRQRRYTDSAWNNKIFVQLKSFAYVKWSKGFFKYFCLLSLLINST